MVLADIRVRATKSTDKQYQLIGGGGIHLLVHPDGSKYWRLRYRYEGKQEMLALGVYLEITLADARVRHDEMRKLLTNDVDPGDKKKNDKVKQSKARTFEEVAIEWHDTNKKWSEDHAHRVLRSLEDNLFVAPGERSITELKTRGLLVLIKTVKMSGRLEVAARLQQHTTAIMRYAAQSELIDHNLAQEMAGAVASCNRQRRSVFELKRTLKLPTKIDSCADRPLARWVIELALLIFIRSSELRFTRWSETDFEVSIWAIPPGREPIPGVKHPHRGLEVRITHLVPLLTQIPTILKQIRQLYEAYDLIFIGDHDSYRSMSENTVNSALRVTRYDTKVEACGRDLRTMACSSLVESGPWSRGAVERQMDHMARNSVRAAYIHKIEHLEEQRLMLQWWTDFLDVNRKKFISPFKYTKINNLLKQ